MKHNKTNQREEKQITKQRLKYCTVRAKKQRRRRRNEDEQSARQISATYAISLLFVFNFCYLSSPPLSFFSLSARRKREKQQQDTPRLLCTFSTHTHTHSYTLFTILHSVDETVSVGIKLILQGILCCSWQLMYVLFRLFKTAIRRERKRE